MTQGREVERLIERLRQRKQMMSADPGRFYVGRNPDPLCQEAASELERLVADARRMEFLHDKCSVSFMFRRTDGTNAMKLREPLNFDQLQRVMSQHFGARELTDDEADSAESFARAIERAHGIGA